MDLSGAAFVNEAGGIGEGGTGNLRELEFDGAGADLGILLHPADGGEVAETLPEVPAPGDRAEARPGAEGIVGEVQPHEQRGRDGIGIDGGDEGRREGAHGKEWEVIGEQ